ncbi:MAG: HAD family hydrolase, partial [Negativicutes bacterium]|nr:HAD family hydrolase [Negativicutes bacterium]
LRTGSFMIEAVIFDMDGVLIDSEPLYYANHNQQFARFGFQLSWPEYRQYVGTPDVDMWLDLKRRFGERVIHRPVEELCRLAAESYQQLLWQRRNKLCPIEGVVELLSELKAEGYSLAVASSSHRPVIELVVDALGISRFFTALVSGDDVGHGNPAPDIFIEAAGRLVTPPGSCLVIEDSANGVKAAKAAGMKVVGFYNPNSGGQDIAAADVIIDNFVGWDWRCQLEIFAREQT